MSDHLVRGHVTASGDRLDGGQVEPPGEHGKAGEHRPLGCVQQLPGPVDHGKQRLLAGESRPRAAGQDGEALIEPRVQLGRRHDPQPGRAQLDGQRHAVQLPADTADDRSGPLVPAERYPVLRGAVDEEPHGLRGGDRAHVIVIGRGVEGRDQVDALAVDAQRLTARREQRDVPAIPEQGVGQLGARVDDVLAVVQQHEQAPLADRLDESVENRAARVLRDAEHLGHGGRDQVRVLQRGEIREPHSVAGAVQQPGRGLEREPGLPAPPGPVSVTRRELAIRRRTSASSPSRPMKLDTWTGRLFSSLGLSSDFTAGKAVARPSASSWKICSGRPRSFSRCRPRSLSEAPAGIESRSKAAVVAESTTCPP